MSLAAEEARVTFAPAALGLAELEQAVERAGYKAHTKAEQPSVDEFARQDLDRAREYPDVIVVAPGKPVRLR